MEHFKLSSVSLVFVSLFLVNVSNLVTLPALAGTWPRCKIVGGDGAENLSGTVSFESGALCAASEEGAPNVCSMKAYFENSHKVTLWFKEFETKDRSEYAIAVVGVALLSYFSVLLKVVREACKNIMLKDRAGSIRLILDHLVLLSLALITIFLDFFNMLAAMTFNVGIFSAVCIGWALGYVQFHYTAVNVLTERASDGMTADCC